MALKRCGHIGTLDPLASGVLPVLIGKATKLSDMLMNHDKEYICTLKLGIKTETLDLEGEIIQKEEENNKIKNIIQSKEKIVKVLNLFKGEIEQTPPIYSAIKINGRKAYEIARSGETVDIPKRKVTIFSIELLEINKENFEIKFKVNCSKGTYIRSLCDDIAKKLGTIGTMTSLIRTRVRKF